MTTLDRYIRQLNLDNFSQENQLALSRAKVLIIGAGGLGAPVAHYLCAAGVGSITVMDNDRVSLSNLHRQLFYKEEDIGLYKVDSLVKSLIALNSTIEIFAAKDRFNLEKHLDYTSNFDVLVDCSDNFLTRYSLNDASVINKKPLVSAALSSHKGQLSVFSNKGSACYRCLFPDPRGVEALTNCSEGGILGPLAGMMANLQALEVIKTISSYSEPLVEEFFMFDSLKMESKKIPYEKSDNCFCSNLEISVEYPNEICPTMLASSFISLEQSKEFDIIVDIRESQELLRDGKLEAAVHMPLSTTKEKAYLDLAEGKKYSYIL